MKQTKSATKRNEILHAAAKIVRDKGVERLTLEAVAQEAGVSKGGLLYHFPNKESLINGMISELTIRYVEEIDTRAETDTIENGKWTRAYLEATKHEMNTGLEMSASLLAATFTNPQLLDDLQKQFAYWQQQIENDGTDPIHSIIAKLAADGMWFAEIFGLAPLEKEMRERVFNEMISWTKERNT